MKLYITVQTKEDVNIFPESYDNLKAAQQALSQVAMVMTPGEVLTLHEYGTGDTMDRWFDAFEKAAIQERVLNGKERDKS